MQGKNKGVGVQRR